MEKKATKTELLLIALTIVAVIFTAGFLIGRSTKQRATIIYNKVEDTAVEPDEEPAPVIPIESAVPDVAPQSDSTRSMPVPPSDEPNDSKGRININTADAQALQELPGIGEVLAGRIVDYRRDHGDFSDIEEIMAVSGIGDSKFDAIKELITVG